ncbi:DUF2254 domain-containing protein [Alkalicoccus saliphilus]|uniref:DUF2254 domain-containing protein n=1 Tax=Alkalicoccus saliphilus TaxID=200989 RepID=A0A2T4U9V0_9BACI|nr:DUF2254 domain-containing protein [Alkalicoccus saliphilus]
MLKRRNFSLYKWLPESLRKYFQMNRRERKHEMQSTLWYMPLLYITLSLLLVAATLTADILMEAETYVPPIMRISAEATQVLVSTLIGGILTLSAFTLNSLLVFLTTFSGQFSPRMLLNFVSDKKTQHALGIFNGNFVYVLVVFLFIGSTQREVFAVVPAVTISVTFLSSITFIYFINHATTWMQVHNITDTMKKNSQKIIKTTLSEELEVYRTKEPGYIMNEEKSKETFVPAERNGYIQLIDYRKMIEHARRDNVIIQFHVSMGEYVLEGNTLFSYWGKNVEAIDENQYFDMIRIGHKELEVQDLHLGMHKLSEIAVKSLGNNDPKTVINSIHQMAELMLNVVSHVTFTPYLVDHDRQVRVILVSESFESYLHKGFGYIRFYAGNDHLIIAEMTKAFSKLAPAIDEQKKQAVWDFIYDTALHLDPDKIYRLDRKFLLEAFKQLADETGRKDDYQKIELHFS